MTYQFQNGKIVTRGKLYEDAVYHVSNEKLSAIFNGKGIVSSYALANEKEYLTKGYLILFYRGIPVDVYTEKTVQMIGRCQTVCIELGDATLEIKQFLDRSVNAVFTSYTLKTKRSDDHIDVGISFEAHSIKTLELSNDQTSAYNEAVSFCSDIPIDFANENATFYLTVPANRCVHTVLSFGETETGSQELLANFQDYEMAMQAEIEELPLPKNLNEQQKALFYSAYFCALQNYKEKGDYKAFMAGHHYLLPMRSYYRDSYYTVLPMYRLHPEKVKNQIITLAHGISENGDCPSAVKSDYTEWWGNHYDSPSFLAMMLYDYVKFTKDKDFLYAPIKKSTVLEQAVNAIEKLSTYADETGLLYKEGKYNQRDWADEVNRGGYVTYNEILYARALFCLAELHQILGNSQKALDYLQRFDKVKKAIDKILWDDNLGHYVNFKTHEYTESNLSVDTCLAAVFDIADNQKAVRMLKNMEAILESKNNREQQAGDYGVMSVYPFYSQVDSARHKSSQPYYYHNGANWPYLSAMYAYAKRKYGMEYRYALESWFEYNVARGNYTPVEFFSPPQPDGSLLQAWCGAAAFVMDEEISQNFWTES